MKNQFFRIKTYTMKLFEKCPTLPLKLMSLIIDFKFILRWDTRWPQKSPLNIEPNLTQMKFSGQSIDIPY